MSHHGNQKFSSAPVIHAMASTMSSCLPNLKLLYPFSSLVNFDRFCEVNPNSPPIDARSSNDSSASCRPPASSLKLNPVYVDSPLPSGECLPRHLVTPKGRRLSIGPSSADRNRASEFWNYYDMWVNCSLLCNSSPLPLIEPITNFHVNPRTQRILRGENPFETRSPVKPRVTDSARRLHRKLRR